MNYWISIGEREYQVSLQNGQVYINGELEPKGELIRLNRNGLHMLRRGQRDVEVHLQTQQPGTVEVLIGAQRVIARVETLQQRAGRRTETAHAGTLTAPMPGLVVGMHVQEGDQVVCGQVIAVIESMKMQMQMRAPIDGTVSKVHARAGDQVEKGTLLVLIQD